MSETTDGTASDAAAQTAALPAVLSLAPQTASPVEVGSFELDDSGRLRKRHETTPIAFSFLYHGRRFEAEVEVGDRPNVRLSVVLGKLPYTAEAPGLRRHLREMIHLTRSHESGRLLLSRSQDITFTAEALPPKPFTPVSLMATLVSLLLKSQVLLDPIGETLDGPRHQSA